MKAVRIHSFGGPEVLKYEDAPNPVLKNSDDVLVKVHAIGINPVDWKTRSRRGMDYGDNPFPLTLGWDISGVVEASNSPEFKPGDEVFGMIHFPGIGSAYAEYIVAPASHLALKPENVTHVQAAAIPLAALTAWQALFEAVQLEAGHRILIHAAAGGVGHLAVQLAKWKGAHVIGISSAHNREFLEKLRVDQIVDRNQPDYADSIQPVDIVLDTFGGETVSQSYRFVKPGGAIVSIANHPDPEESARYGVTATAFLVRPVAEHLHAIAKLMQSCDLQAEIATVFPLQETAKAHELGAVGHTRGKIVLRVV